MSETLSRVYKLLEDQSKWSLEDKRKRSFIGGLEEEVIGTSEELLLQLDE